MFPPSILGIILFLAGAELAMSGRDPGPRQNRPLYHPYNRRPGSLECRRRRHFWLRRLPRIETRMARSIDWSLVSAMSTLLAAMPERTRGVTRWQRVEQNQFVFARGDMPRAMYFVVSGEVKLIRPSQVGGEIVLQRARRGFLAEASLDQRAYHCDAVATELTELFAIPRRAFCDALDDTLFRTQWIGHLARELRTARAHSERLSLRTVRERITHYIEVEGEGGSVTLTESKKDWAAALGLTHEALYRALSQMQKDDQLSVDGATLRLKA